MYNRYIPQSDGSYKRKQVPDQSPRPTPPPKPDRCETPCPPSCDPLQPEPQRPCPPHPCPRQRQTRQGPKAPNCTPKSEHPGSCGDPAGFLKNLLPRDFDTGDLLIVLLLLLMAGDQQKDQNTALLTLALYLFL